MAQPDRDNTGARRSTDAGREAIQAIRTLVDARDIRAAKQQLRRIRTHLDDPTWAMIGEIANTLRYKTHDVAITKLRKLWRDNEQHRALIEACVPKTDQHQYIPDTQPAATTRTDPPWRRPGRVARRVDETKRTDPRQRTGSAGAARVDAYEDQLTTEERKEQGTPRPELIVDRRDYDRDAVARVTEPLCVSCRLERASIDRWTGQITTGHGDDGLCGTCREDGRTGIPELPLGHSRSQAIRARLDTIATNFDSHNPGLFRHEWRYGDRLTKSVTADWVKQRNPNGVVRQTATTKLIDLNGECTECGDWRQLRDDLCADCHKGLNGDIVIVGSLDPLAIKGTFKKDINDDAAIEDQTVVDGGVGRPEKASYLEEFMQRLEAGGSEDDSAAVMPADHDTAAAITAFRREGSSGPRSDRVNPRCPDSGASAPDIKQRNRKEVVKSSSNAMNAGLKPSEESAGRRRQQARSQATTATGRARRM
ncbi:hypothetical protein F3087_45010 [Nocardia colli]|uniref:Uncharacterized protein n=1 Tax=Nocardia colli TaxID=2545717 RepID=A0A5N0DKX1_9NOCA|nr:hypothetical protein [Nocardia colli]KAA8877336.1 hypothetical protein F3087_45010 [Nocardia colli]